MLVASAAPAVAQSRTAISREACRPVVDGELRRMNIAAGQVSKIEMVRESYIGGRAPSSEAKAISAWVYPKSCAGQIVFEMGPNCTVYSRYTRGQCRVAGVKNYR